MSNRRRPTKQIPLNGNPFAKPKPMPLALQHMEWTDQPAADYDDRTLTWIADRRREAGRLNAWRCEACGLPFIAYDRHPGVTPMTVAHQTFAETLGEEDPCRGVCVSVFYNGEGVTRAAIDLGQGGQQIQPSHEWYRPSADELRRERREARMHVMQGGLLLRRAAA